MKNQQSALFTLVPVLLFVGCGGGGSSSAPPMPQSYTVGGSVTGLTGSGLVLQNGNNTMSVATSGAFIFAQTYANGAGYAVTVATQPLGQSCTVANGTGAISGTNVVNVAVSCQANRYAVGGTVNGYSGTGLVLQNNGGDDLSVGSSGAFAFATSLQTGATFNVTVKSQPVATPAQSCSVANASGTMATGAITNVVVDCRAATGKFVYVINSSSADVSAFKVNAADGTLTAIAGSPFAGGGISPAQAVVHPSGKFMYLNGFTSSNPVTGSLTGFAINETTGALTLITGVPLFYSSNGVVRMAMHPSGNFLVTFHAGLTSGANVFRIDQSTGALTLLTSTLLDVGGIAGTFDAAGNFLYVSARAVGGGALSFSFNQSTGALTQTNQISAPGLTSLSPTLDPTGKFLYVKNIDLTLGSPLNSISAFDLNPNGGLWRLNAGSPFPAGQYPISLIFNRTGDLAFVTNLGISGTSNTVPGPGSVSVYRVNSVSGDLAAISGSPFATNGYGANSSFLDVSGKYFVSSNFVSGTVAVFSINGTSGALSHVSGSPFAVTSSGGLGAARTDPSGAFVYITDSNMNRISLYSFNAASGALALVASYPTGSSPSTFSAVIVGAQ